MEWSEKDLEDYLENNPDELRCDFILGRQVNVGVGTIDLLGLRFDDQCGPTLVVVELKKGPIDCNAIGQCARYVNALREQHMHRIIELKDDISGFVISGALVGFKTEDDAMVLATELRYDTFTYEPHFTADLKSWSRKKPHEWLAESGINALNKALDSAVNHFRNSQNGCTEPGTGDQDDDGPAF